MLIDDLSSILTGRVMVVGVGDVTRGDDSFGPRVAGLLEDAGVDGVIDSGASPELDTWKIREFRPESVLFIDAVDFGGSPGEVAILEPAELRGNGFDTHRAPLKLTMEYLEQEIRCKCLLLAVQPKDVRIGAAASEEVLGSVKQVAEMLKTLLIQSKMGES